ncbi:MAG: Holliday junction resolvase RuvX [Bacteriovoracaceae bacterium]|nr:Holliday junction resolvase RuvX [Bacteriovoracaceae bacterium]
MEFQHKRLLAIDWGEKFIGIATYHVGVDPMILAWGRIKGGVFEIVWKDLKKILDDESIDEIIVGVPFFTDGKPGSMTHKARDFLNNLVSVCSLRVHEQDETLSTFEAEERMKKSPRYNFQVNLSEIDAVSATVILEDFLRSKGHKNI